VVPLLSSPSPLEPLGAKGGKGLGSDSGVFGSVFYLACHHRQAAEGQEREHHQHHHSPLRHLMLLLVGLRPM